jgi:ketosteroid isomerase-like protein
MVRIVCKNSVLLTTVVGLAAANAARATEPLPAFDRAARIEEVRRAELAFADSVMANRPERFVALLDDGAVFVGGEVSRGKAEIVAAWRDYFGPDRPYFEWHPEVVELSADGELGLSRGPWTIRGKGKGGAEFEQKGTYNSIWRRQADSTWRVIFDAGCPPCPRCGG